MPGQAPGGSWWGLVSVYRQSKAEFAAFVSSSPLACPVDGEPLSNSPATASGSGTERYCRFDGWSWPRDYQAPVRL